ncbi:SMI1/KNR4 family protein [Kitasatospora sp. NPDC086791]|uniref:SMI1/KNR4 family protein n=1 Tax=Kitasatospora sp. NPDC086791 TaxID=3155178 RepID=UPI00343E9EDA
MAREFDISRLLELMPPHEGAGESGDWAAVEQAWGLRFPRDYTEFIARYGNGGIEECVSVLAPDELMPPDAPQPGMHNLTEEARWLFEEDGEPTEEVRCAEQLVAWGGSSTADTLCWLTVGDDPDAWPVVVLGRNGGAPQVFRMGMAEFLHRMLTAEIDPCPIGITDAWGCEFPRFVHWRLSRQRYRDRLDPLTGGPRS